MVIGTLLHTQKTDKIIIATSTNTSKTIKCCQTINKQRMKQNVDKTTIIVIITVIIMIIIKMVVARNLLSLQK